MNNINLGKKIPLPVVGIGGSAGSIESLERFFHQIPSDLGIAYIVIIQLEKSEHDLLPKTLENHTSVKVNTIKSGTKIMPDCIYLTPHRKNLTIKNGILHLSDLKTGNNLPAPINDFFTSLAKDKKENVVGILLSGHGSDGAEGLTLIKKNGGAIYAQDPFTAEFDSMPKSAIAKGIVDFVLMPEHMPSNLLKWRHFGLLKDGKISPPLEKIFQLLRNYTGHDFSFYKLNTISRRIEKQMYTHRMNNLNGYINFLKKNPYEINNLLKDLLIGVTSFFRDPEAFDVLKKEILPKLIKNNGLDYNLRIWIPGCSTGEEVYSIAITLFECMEELQQFCNVQIFGTDIDLSALDVARMGAYTEDQVSNILPKRLKRFFTREKNNYLIRKDIRRMVVFGAQNITKDPPFTRLDMIVCRNLLIYLNTAQQKKLFPLFHYSLKPNGMLFLGTSESIAESIDLFKVSNTRWKFFEKNNQAITLNNHVAFPNLTLSSNITSNLLLPLSHNKPRQDDKVVQHQFLRKYFLDHHISPSFVIDKKGNILHTHNKQNIEAIFPTNKNNIHQLFPKSLNLKIKDTVKKAITLNKEVIIKNATIKEYKFGHNIKISPIYNEPLLDLILVTFEKIFSPHQTNIIKEKYSSLTKMSKKILELERELQQSKDNLQSAIEELQSNNEELQSTNEELQSTNEEIETTKEELQSLNEELLISNSELQNQIDQLASVNDDINNLFNCTEVAAIIIDTDLNVRRFTPKVQDLIHLIPTDIGRPIKHFSTNFEYENLIRDISRVINTLNSHNVELKSYENQWIKVSIMPYRTFANIIDGVIIVFKDISHEKSSLVEKEMLSDKLEKLFKFKNTIFNTLHQPMIITNSQFVLQTANHAFYNLFSFSEDEIYGKSFLDIFHQWSQPSLLNALNNIITKDIIDEKADVIYTLKDGTHKKFILHFRKIQNHDGQTVFLIEFMEKYA